MIRKLPQPQAKTERRVCNYTQMGMANRKNGEPTLQWALLRAFAEERGVLDWDSRRKPTGATRNAGISSLATYGTFSTSKAIPSV